MTDLTPQRHIIPSKQPVYTLLEQSLPFFAAVTTEPVALHQRLRVIGESGESYPAIITGITGQRFLGIVLAGHPERIVAVKPYRAHLFDLPTLDIRSDQGWNLCIGNVATVYAECKLSGTHTAGFLKWVLSFKPSEETLAYQELIVGTDRYAKGVVYAEKANAQWKPGIYLLTLQRYKGSALNPVAAAERIVKLVTPASLLLFAQAATTRTPIYL